MPTVQARWGTRPSRPATCGVNYANASIVVPANWQTLLPRVATCDDDVVLLGNAVSSCGAGQSARPASFAHLQGLPARLPRGTSETINGQAATLVARSGGARTHAFAALGVELEVAGPHADSIVHSIGWSSRYMVLHAQAQASVPGGWGTTTYEGVAVRLPRSWPLAKVGPAEGEPGCGTDFSTPKLLEGPVFPHTCELVLAEPPLVDGVWLQGPSGLTEAQASAEGYQVLRYTPTKVYFAQSQDPTGLFPLLHLLVATQDGNLDAIDVAWPDPAVAAAIIASITATSGLGDATPNTAAPASQTAPVPTTSPTPAGPGGTGLATPTTPTTPPAPTSLARSRSAPTSSATAAKAPLAEDLVATNAVKTAITAAFAAYKQVPVGDIAGTEAGSVHYAYVPSSSTYWAVARFLPTPSAPSAVDVSFQDGANLRDLVLAGPAQLVRREPCR